jgi:hypothetical protein
MLRLREGVGSAELEYGMALLDENSGEYWNLNPTAALILKTLLEGGSAESAIDELTSRHDVDRSVASRDVDELVSDLRSAGLIEG